VAKDIDQLQGTWKVVSLEMDGRSLAESGSISIKGKTFASSGMGAAYEGTVKLNQSAVPKTFDLKFTTGPEKGNTNRGIYELNGDVWKICLATRGSTRPKEFAAPPGTGIVVEVLKRGEEEQEAEPDKKDWIGDLGYEPASELEGEWAMVSGTFDGMPIDERLVSTGKRIVEGCDMTVLFGKDVYSKGKYTVDRSLTPTGIDMHVARKVQRGIYDVKGKILRLSIAGAGQQRPARLFFQRWRPTDGRGLEENQRVTRLRGNRALCLTEIARITSFPLTSESNGSSAPLAASLIRRRIAGLSRSVARFIRIYRTCLPSPRSSSSGSESEAPARKYRLTHCG
jgi:uncharacterized protein (TIGR03067 family)